MTLPLLVKPQTTASGHFLWSVKSELLHTEKKKLARVQVIQGHSLYTTVYIRIVYIYVRIVAPNNTFGLSKIINDIN